MGRKLTAAIAVCFLVLVWGAAGSRGSVRPDPGFGRDGRVLLPGRIETSVGTALLPDGRTLLAGERQLVALLPSGRIDRSFGDDGLLHFASSPVPSPAAIGAIAVDSRGRIVVVADHGFWPRAEPRRSLALVVRYTPGGRLDPSFGGGDGVLVTDLGLPTARVQPGSEGAPEPIDMWVRSVAVDSGDRIVLSGERATAVSYYKGHLLGRFETFVGRLTVDGEADGTFAGDGVLTQPGIEEIGKPVVDRGDGLYFQLGTGGGRGTLVHLLADGEPDRGFGENGARRVPKGTDGGLLLLDPSGNLLLSDDLHGRKSAEGMTIKRLRPDGSLDRSFGHRGTATVRIPGYGSGVLAGDPRGGVLIAASSSHKRPDSAGMLLARMRPDGSLARHGFARVPFEREEAGLQTAIAAGSKALLSGYWCHRDNCGIALARFRLGSG